MPFRGLFSNGNLEASSSRKRSYAEISRSESRSQSPQQPSSKRRRTGLATPVSSALRHPSISAQTATPHLEQMTSRYEGDGFDFRRPVMSTSAATQTSHTVIDLTDDDSSYTSDRYRRNAEDLERQVHGPAVDVARSPQARNRGPRFGRDIIGEDAEEPEVIDLVDSDDTEDMEPETILDFDEDLFGERIDRSSPEVTFVSERPAPGSEPERAPSRTNRRLPTPHDRRSIINPFSNLRDFVRRNGNYRAMSGSDIDEAREALDRETLDRMDGIREARPAHQTRAEQIRTLDDEARDRPFHPFGNFPIIAPLRPGSADLPDIIDVEALDIVMNLDYGHAAFEVVDQDRLEIIQPPPLPWHTAINRRRGGTPGELVKEPYPKPAAKEKGFTMNFQEDDHLECPSCHDELSVGVEGSIKTQVWMVKTCGHVYCGNCTVNRHVKKKGKVPKLDNTVKPFSKCLVEDCGKSVSGRTTMFQVYL